MQFDERQPIIQKSLNTPPNKEVIIGKEALTFPKRGFKIGRKEVYLIKEEGRIIKLREPS